MTRAASRILYWCETTDAQPFETGIQRVTRRLRGGLEQRGLDPLRVGWDTRGRAVRSLRPTGVAIDECEWLVVPEIPTTALTEGIDPIQVGRAYGLRTAAIVHDLIPIRLAHLYPPEAAAQYRRYYRMFAGADLVLATTRLVAGHLSQHLAAEGLRLPEIAVVPLPAQLADLPRVRTRLPARERGSPLRLVTVATWEPRKNLAGLLRAVKLARERGAPIEATLVGRRGDHVAHDAEVDALLAGLPGCRALSRIDDSGLAALFATHHASVYPSCEEGFGMPVLESLWLGRPCLCHSGSAMAEVAPGGGTLMLDMESECALADALTRLADDPKLLCRLAEEAFERPLRDWTAYAAEVAERIGLARA